MNRIETFSFLPPLTNVQIEAQIQYMLKKHCHVSIEYMDDPGGDDYFWNNWPIPEQDGLSPSDILAKADACSRRHPYAHVRISGYEKTQRRCILSFIARLPLDAA